VDLEATVRDLARRLLGYCILRTGDPALAEEIAQESLTALVQHWRRHGQPRSPEGFVFAVARRRAARAVFRRRLLLPLEHLRARRDQSPDPEALLVEHDERRRMISALARLRRADRELILLVGVADVAVAEAARLLDISASALKMRVLRAKRRLRALLENGDALPGRH
jgi:RNA polymerase sigma factor (sigma-70 family)